MGIKCRLGLHNWVHNTSEVIDGTIRTCDRCGREEIYINWCDGGQWYKCLQGEQVTIPDNCKFKIGEVKEK